MASKKQKVLISLGKLYNNINLSFNTLQMYNGPERKSLRLNKHDYSQNGYYFVTICTKARETYFGEISEGKMTLNEYGKIAEEVLLHLSEHYKNSIIDEYIFMPNHFHRIIIIDNTKIVQDKMIMQNETIVGNGFKPFPTEYDKQIKHGLSEIIRGFKTFSSRNINNSQNDFTFRWQKSFYDVIIKNDEQLEKTREYIMNNPLKWELDKNNPINIVK